VPDVSRARDFARNESSGDAYWDRRVQSSDAVRENFDDPQTYKIIGAAMAVHRQLGCGFLEAVSREALTIELQERGVPFVREVRLPVRYRSRLLPVFYTVDFICFDEVLVEVKALHAIGPNEVAQLINYLRIARRRRGLLLNFGATSLQHRRLVLDVRADSAGNP
jgi:GxxExxY protein